MEFQQKPVYTLNKLKTRAIIPKAFALFFLSVIFYLGILVNIAFLEMSAEQETLVKLIALLLVIILIGIGVYLSFHRAHMPYYFTRTFLISGKKKISYSSITNTTPKQNFLDKLFKTYSIQINEKNTLKHIPQELDMKTYLDQLIAFSRSTKQS